MMRTVLGIHGDTVSVSTLQAWCPTASRRAIAAWVRRQRQQRRRRLHVVQWRQAGRVWAMDLSHPPHPIEGQYRELIHVRDLGSHCQLAALPVARGTASAVCGLLRALSAVADPPLVLKVDNGAPFVSHQLRYWAAAVGTALLYSPPCCPQYNGAIEASIGALTTRAHHAAVAAGHPTYWTCDDIEHARTAANRARSGGRMPDALWQRKTRISVDERRSFQAHYTAALHRRSTLTPRVQQRTAIVDTLQDLGYVSMVRRADLVHH